MKKLFVILCALVGLQAHATQMSLSFDKADYAENDTIWMSVWLSDFNSILTSYSATVQLNQGAWMYDWTQTFNEVLGTDGVDAGYVAFDDFDPSLFYVGGFTYFLADSDLLSLASLQTDRPLKLGEFSFTAGSALKATDVSLVEFQATFFDPTTGSEGDNNDTVVPPSVPAPATFWLFAPALWWLARRR